LTAKEYLQNIRDLHLDIIAKEKDLAELKQQAESLQNTALTERVQSSKSNSSNQTIDEVIDIENLLNEKKTMCNKLIMSTYKIIIQISEEKYRRVLIEYYFNCRTWSGVSDVMHLNKRWVFRLHGRALQEFEKIFKLAT
jgi:hypothetical protein